MSEKRSVDFARADLLDEALCVVTPVADTVPEATKRTVSFWISLGCRVKEMPPDEHDRLVAFSSHLPHVVAAMLVEGLPDEALGAADELVTIPMHRGAESLNAAAGAAALLYEAARQRAGR